MPDLGRPRLNLAFAAGAGTAGALKLRPPHPTAVTSRSRTVRRHVGNAMVEAVGR